jgi:phosphohistidine phosphatase
MNLYLIRHATAEEPSAGQIDSERRLTLKGQEQAKLLRKTLQALEIRFDCVISSPWRRARQTASALESVADELETSDLLAQAPGQALSTLINEASSTHSSLALVGHQPWMGELTSLLLTGSTDAARAFAFKKSSLYALEFTPGDCYLKFVLPPGVLRKLKA